MYIKPFSQKQSAISDARSDIRVVAFDMGETAENHMSFAEPGFVQMVDGFCRAIGRHLGWKSVH